MAWYIFFCRFSIYSIKHKQKFVNCEFLQYITLLIGDYHYILLKCTKNCPYIVFWN